MPSVQDIMLLCRLCSVKDKVTVPIFGEDDANDIPLKISACLPVKVSLEDNLPKKICDTCLNKLESLYQFWNEAANTERKFLDWLSQDELIADDDSPDAESSEFDSMTIKREEELIDVPDVNFSDVKSLSADPIAITKQIEDLESTNSYEPPFKRSKTDDNVVPIQRAEDNKDISSLVITSTIDIDSETKTEKESENALDQSELQNFVPVDEELQPGTSGIVQPVNEETCEVQQLHLSSVQIKNSTRLTFVRRPIITTTNLQISKDKHQTSNKTQMQKKTNLHTCGACGEVFISDHILRTHRIKVHYKEGMKCDTCSKSFSMPHLLKKHKSIHCDRNCATCDRRFKSAKGFKNHILSHMNEHNFKCEFCSKTFVSQTVLNSHNKITHFHICELCEKTFTSSEGLRLHVKSIHCGSRIKCHLCSREVKNIVCLREHLKKHRKDRTYLCDICGRTFLVLSSLKSHVNKHKGEKPYVCEVCGKGFTASRFLVGHMRVHTKAKPYVCKLCNKAFAEKGTLNTHMKGVHNEGERNYKCVCGKMFKIMSSLIYHRKKYHGNPLSEREKNNM